MPDPDKLRELASWYREFAERAANPMIWEARLLTAEDLDRHADQIEQRSGDRGREAAMNGGGSVDLVRIDCAAI
jgi:hypothetical protein